MSLRFSFFLTLGMLARFAGWADPPSPLQLLRQQLTRATTDSSRSRILADIAQQYAPVDVVSAFHFLDRSLRLARISRDSLGITRALCGQAFIHLYYTKNEQKVADLTRKVIALAQPRNDFKHLAMAYQYLGLIANHQHIGDPDGLFQKAIGYAKKADDWRVLNNAYQSVFTMHRDRHDYKQAAVYNTLALKSCKQYDIDTWLTVGLDYCTMLEQQGKMDEAFAFAQTLQSSTHKLRKSYGEFVYTNDLGLLNTKLRRYLEAETILLKGIVKEQQRTHPDSLHLFYYYQSLIDNYVKQGAFGKAYHRANDLAEVRLWLQRVRQTRDSKLETTRLKASLDLEEKQNEISRIQARQNQQWLLLGGISIIVLVLGSTVMVLRKSGQRIERQRTKLAELNGVKDRLFSIVGHDLRGPVMTLQQSLDRLESADSSITLSNSLPHFRQSVNTVVALTDNVLCWALAQMGGLRTRLQAFDLSIVIDDVLRLYAELIRQKQIDLILDLDDLTTEELTILADEAQTEIVVRNIVQNAIKFSPVSGQLHIKAERQANGLQLSIANQGPVFNWQPGQLALSQTSTGLGLTVAAELMQRNGGTVQLIGQTGSTPGTIAQLGWPLPPNQVNNYFCPLPDHASNG